ncbi:DUF2490 domain-containing protein [Aureicoccus marinus]|uniref:DUF2490 domain-containing protein n=1 Tax=Aureicoccus marinus TaxID=754435 RepID=A0A2S7T5K9_9FLAO|nr:DUF2490 domain-containing protein [Aureicoccus marinus]PQJ14775.1 hypothetical protein BST99_02585 [Aureicoccus marinus]
MKNQLTLLLALLFSGSVFSQAIGGATDPQAEDGIWYMYFGMNRLSDKISLHTEAQFRYYQTEGNFNQMLLRTGINFHVKPNAILTAGYAYIDTDPTFMEQGLEDGFFNGNEILEHRIFEQLILTNKVGEFLFEHRYRLEQRFIENTDLNTTDTKHRARYRLQVTLPLTNTFFLNFYDEVFVNLQEPLFDQNRLYGALGIRITENASVQLGYLKNHFSGANFDRYQVGFFFNPDFRKK